MEGVLNGLKAAGLDLKQLKLGFASLIQNHDFRMFGQPDEQAKDSHIVWRGNMCSVGDDRVLLATTGRSATSSHSLGTPQPLEIRVERPSADTLESINVDRVNQYSAVELCEHLMALTQLSWSSMRREVKLPVTISYSQKVASLSSRAEISNLPAGKRHRPWFV